MTRYYHQWYINKKYKNCLHCGPQTFPPPLDLPLVPNRLVSPAVRNENTKLNKWFASYIVLFTINVRSARTLECCRMGGRSAVGYKFNDVSEEPAASSILKTEAALSSEKLLFL